MAKQKKVSYGLGGGKVTRKISRHVKPANFANTPTVAQIAEDKPKIIEYGNGANWLNDVIHVLSNSPTAWLCWDKRAKFIKADGFASAATDAFQVNPEQTAGDLLPFLAWDAAPFGFALRVKYGTDLKVAEVYHVPFPHVRKLSNGQYLVNPTLVEKHDTTKDEILDAFDDNPKTVRALLQEAQATGKQAGQLVYAYLGNSQQPIYPVPGCWAAAEDMRYEQALLAGDHASFKKRVKTSLIVKLTGKLDRVAVAEDGHTEYSRTMAVISAIVDEDTTEDPVVIEAAIKEALPEFEFLDSIKDLLSYAKKREDIGRSICRWWLVPPALVGWETPGQLGGNQQLATYVGMMQQEVLDVQSLIERIFTRLFPNFDWILTNYRILKDIEDREWEIMTDDEKREAYGRPALENATDQPEPKPSALQRFANIFKRK